MSFSLEDQARIDFVLTLRRRWADRVYPVLVDEYRRQAAAAARPPRTRQEAAPFVHGLDSYPWFAWLERGSQKMLWRAVSDALDDEAAPPVEGQPPGSLRLDPDLELPGWYTDWDIHVQPGGVWSSAKAARVYEEGAKLVMLGQNDDYLFHRLFVETALPDRPYRRIVDLGCGFGKSTWPLKRAFPDAEVIGIDLSAPCLELAYRKNGSLGLAIDYRQADARDTGIEAGSCDLVTSTMLLHEVPRPVLDAIIAESARLLAPGGLLRMLDFQFTGDPVRDLAMQEHGQRNNEPFMPGLMVADMAEICGNAGLVGTRWVAFDERGGGRLDDAVWPERREWHFPWAVLEAEKPA